jgi:hypothetical protein
MDVSERAEFSGVVKSLNEASRIIRRWINLIAHENQAAAALKEIRKISDEGTINLLIRRTCIDIAGLERFHEREAIRCYIVPWLSSALVKILTDKDLREVEKNESNHL